jgi:hypothetical protein
MVFRYALASILLLAVPSAASALAPRCKVVGVRAPQLQVRSFPNGGRVGVVKTGDRLRMLAEDVDSLGRGWARVGRLGPSGVIAPIGWMRRSAIQCPDD